MSQLLTASGIHSSFAPLPHVAPSPVRAVEEAPVTSIQGMEVSEHFFQQGDVLLELVTEDQWPKSEGEWRKLHKRDDRRLAVSAATGYSHEASSGSLYEVSSYGRAAEGELWLDAPKGAVVRHHEHKAILLPPGKYRVFGVVEFDPFEAEGSVFAVRRVID